MQKLSINQAAALGIERVRKPIWVTPEDHVKIDIIDGKPGPWTHLFCPGNKMINGRDPVDMLFLNMDYDDECFVEYTGPVSGSDEYKAAAAHYARFESMPSAPTRA